MKPCKTCKIVKPLTDFYLQPGGKDGRHTECKECRKAAIKARYGVTRPERAAYERKRFNDPARKAKVAEYQRSHRQREPLKYKARTAVNNAIRDGRLKKGPCEECGCLETQAHHDDYSKPLEVRWFCFKHHRQEAHGQVVVSVAEGASPFGVDKVPLRGRESGEAASRKGCEEAVVA